MVITAANSETNMQNFQIPSNHTLSITKFYAWRLYTFLCQVYIIVPLKDSRLRISQSLLLTILSSEALFI
jgi:hypothetical protein